MDQINTNMGGELPAPEHLTSQLENLEVVVPSSEALDKIPAPGERISQASGAVAQATDVTSAPIQSIVDDGVKAQMKSAVDDDQLIADDIDVIEKEWVQKAKNIVDNTKDDPKQQSDQLNSLKKTYIKNRYNKDIKLVDQQSG